MNSREKMLLEVTSLQNRIKKLWDVEEINPEIYVRAYIAEALHLAGNFPPELIKPTLNAIDIRINMRYNELINIEGGDGDALQDLAYAFTNDLILNRVWAQSDRICLWNEEDRKAVFLSSLNGVLLALE